MYVYFDLYAIFPSYVCFGIWQVILPSVTCTLGCLLGFTSYLPCNRVKKKMFCLKRTSIRAHLSNKIFNHASDLGNIPSWACCTSVCDNPYDDSRSWACTSVCDNPYNDSRDSDIIIRCDLVRPIFLIPIWCTTLPLGLQRPPPAPVSSRTADSLWTWCLAGWRQCL